VVHTYADHVSILKFIERKWRLNPLTDRSRDDLPNPIIQPQNPYVPANVPAIGDMFHFAGDPDRAHFSGGPERDR
jgi:phospholipase C